MTEPVTSLDKLSAALSDRYAIEREIGAGGMATVYLAQDIRHDRKVAVKVLRPELSAILGAERFLKEIRLTANLQHPHILPLHDSGTADGTVFYVMPYVEGESLRQRIARDKQLPVDEAVRIAKEVASALDYAHRHGVVHRDIKPENILLHDGQALVADFGIALAVSSAGGGTRMTETGMSLGTPHYMSPEQAMGEREITARSDVYALGCVLYEMLVGEPPFTGPTAQAIIARVVTEEPRSLRLQRKSIPENVEAAVNTALSKMPADRFSSAAQFAEALGRSDYAPPATRATRSRPAARGLRQRAQGALPWTLFGAALIVGAFGWMRTTEPDVTQNRIMLWKARTPATVVGRLLALSPDGRGMAFVDTVGARQQIWLKERHRLEAVIVAGTVGALSPSFSSDGEWIAFYADGKLKKVPRLGGSPITLSDSAGQGAAPAWLADGTILFTNPNSELLAIDENGGVHRRVFTSNPDQRLVVAVSGLPGSRAALIATCQPGCPDPDLRALDLETGTTNILATEALNGWYLDGHIVFIRRDGGAFAARFDLGELGFRSPPVPVLDGVRTGVATADMAVSPSGTLVYVPGAAQAGATVEPVWVTRSGAVSVVDSSWSYVSPVNWGISLSPDGRLLAVGARVAGSDDIWIKELQGGVLRRLTFQGSNSRPVGWAHGGRSLIYTAINRGNSDLRIRSADGTGADTIFADTRNPIFEAVVTSDSGGMIARTGGSPSRDILLLRRGDSTVTGLVASDQYQEVGPALSRNGRWLAYASDETGRYEVYVRPFPDVNAGKWQISRNGGSEALWAHNGRELFYRDAAGNFIAAAVVTTTTFSSGEQRILFPARDLRNFPVARGYDVTPDDNRFVFTRIVGTSSEDDPALPVVLVENWSAEIKNATRSRR